MPSERDELLGSLRAWAEALLRAAPGGARRWAHSERVYGLGRRLARQEGADRFVVGVAALFHELPQGGGTPGLDLVAGELAARGVPDSTIAAILDVIATIDREEIDRATPATRAVWEAHRLDALGAFGIADLLLNATADATLYERTDPFALLRALDPEQALIDRLYARIVALPRQMRSKTARQIAIRRTGIMLFYLESLRDELAETLPDALLPEADWLVPKDQH